MPARLTRRRGGTGCYGFSMTGQIGRGAASAHYVGMARPSSRHNRPAARAIYDELNAGRVV